MLDIRRGSAHSGKPQLTDGVIDGSSHYQQLDPLGQLSTCQPGTHGWSATNVKHMLRASISHLRFASVITVGVYPSHIRRLLFRPDAINSEALTSRSQVRPIDLYVHCSRMTVLCSSSKGEQRISTPQSRRRCFAPHI